MFFSQLLLKYNSIVQYKTQCDFMYLSVMLPDLPYLLIGYSIVMVTEGITQCQ